MGLWLKQSTAVDFLAGPFIDDADGKTPETALTITQAEVRLSKNGGNMAQKGEATALAHDELGMYLCKLNTTDTNTLGTLQVTIWESGALIVYHEFMVVTANVWDTLCSTDLLQTDLTQMGGVAQSATDLKDFADAGYDPATDKVTGVLLTDTCTTNTDLVTAAAVNTAVEAGDLSLVLADTNELQTDWANAGRLDTILDACALEATVAALNNITADNIWDEVMDANAPANANSAREIVNVMASALVGKASGGGTATLVARDLGDTKDRATLTVTADGNRTGIVVDGT